MRKYKALIIIISISFFIFALGITYSLLANEARLRSSDLEFAKFVFNAKKYDELSFPLVNLKPGDTEDYFFAITNTVSDIKSDVSIEYEILVKTYLIAPLEIKLYILEDEEWEEVFICDNEFERNEDNELECVSLINTMSHESEINNDYKLSISFDGDYSEEEYSGLVDFIDISIKGWQIVLEEGD